MQVTSPKGIIRGVKKYFVVSINYYINILNQVIAVMNALSEFYIKTKYIDFLKY
jgi:hypothetical protein